MIRLRLVAVALLIQAACAYAADPVANRNVVFVTSDGLRWQEIFRGAEDALINKADGGVADGAVAGLRARYGGETAEIRRQRLMPFFWSAPGKSGQVYGNRDKGSTVRSTNGLKFSYPGYSEMLTGRVDAKIDSNDKFLNPNINVFEWIHRQPSFRGRVAAYCTWDVFPFILNEPRAEFPVVAGWEPIPGSQLTERQQAINAMMEACHKEWPDNCFDCFSFEAGLEHLRSGKPRALYIALGETDEHAHHRRYDFYLDSIHRVDQMLARLWETIQSMPEYKNQTTLIVTADHGRGDGRLWTDHGAKVENAEYLWVALMGPEIGAFGEGKNCPEVTQSQFAATIAAALGLDFAAENPGAAPPINVREGFR